MLPRDLPSSRYGMVSCWRGALHVLSLISQIAMSKPQPPQL